MQKAQMSLSKCINAAEMGLTIRETSTLLDIPYRQVLTLSKKYQIKFVCGKRKANERRGKDSFGKSQASAKTMVLIADSKQRYNLKQEIEEIKALIEIALKE